MQPETDEAWSRTRPRVAWLAVMTVLAMMGVLGPERVVAEEQESHESSSEHEGTAEEHGEEHHLHKHHVAFSIGATESVEDHGEEAHGDGHGEGSSGGKDDPDFTIAFDYERRFNKLFGFGGMVDWVVEGRREFMIGPAAFLHPFGGSKFWVGSLAERVRATGDWELVWRLGAAWQFEIGSGKYSISPNVNYDITEEHELWVVGVAIGRGF